jgi:hypothetical protein
LGDELWEVQCWLSDDFPDGTELDPSVIPGPDWIKGWTMSETDQGLIRVSYDNFALAKDLNVWFVFVDEPKSNPAAANLVLFVGDQKPMGTFVSRYAFATMGVANDEQIGAIRWYRDSGMIHQIYIAPKYRQLQLATYLLYSTSAFHHAKGWSGIIHGDGRRTKLGNILAAASAYPNRYRALELQMPPMDLPDEPTE